MFISNSNFQESSLLTALNYSVFNNKHMYNAERSHENLVVQNELKKNINIGLFFSPEIRSEDISTRCLCFSQSVFIQF